MSPRRILVVTVVHHPEDARIRHRQIASLLAAGWEVTFAAPWTGHGVEPPGAGAVPGLTAIDLTRSSGRRRFAAQRDVRRVLREQGPRHDVVLLHDPELVPSTLGISLPLTVWDVHEDTRAVVDLRSWVPERLRGPLRSLAGTMERGAERRMVLILADEDYAQRFAQQHLVVPNTTPVPVDPPPAGTPDEQGRLRVVYLGSLTRERGVAELVRVGEQLSTATQGRAVLEVVGPAHGSATTEQLEAAQRAGHLEWSGFLPADQALDRLDGALAGLSLLHDVANFRPSMPTKVVEYLAHAIPVISTPLPRAVDLVERSGAGTIVPFQDVERTVEQLLAWAQDPAAAADLGRSGHTLARRELDWGVHSEQFVTAMERLADAPR
ncbi:glycosyltransferase [Serinicoccus hydrothermalis]|uniref:glycosyltransferase n=1 Tax=Serinicoccus hydrothermalis TaxID=1758689 RepID=UPI000831286C|nr:glycosyltransferase [Serinicoccus hydrothermalis]